MLAVLFCNRFHLPLVCMGMEYERLNNLSLAQHVSAILSQDSSCRFWLQQCSALYGVQDGWLFMRVAVCAKITPHSQCKMCNVAVSFLSSGSKLDVSIVLQKECCSVYNMPRTSCLTPFPCCALQFLVQAHALCPHDPLVENELGVVAFRNKE